MPDLYSHLPKYIQIKEALRKQIDEGVLREGEQISSEVILIERFGASKMTVIRALQELVQEGYLLRIQGKGTYVIRPGKRFPLIGILIPCVDSGIFPILLHEIEHHARTLGYEVIFCSTEDLFHIATIVSRFATLQVVGIIAIPSENDSDFDEEPLWMEILKQHEIPLVFLDRGMRPYDQLPTVRIDHENAMRDLTTYVIQRGHRRIFFIQPEEHQGIHFVARIQGFQNAIDLARQDVECARIVSLSEKESLESKRANLQQLIEKENPTVLMAINDAMAVELYRLLKGMSPDIQSRMSLTGFDDIYFADVLGLTTVRQPLNEEGRQAVELLHDLLQGLPARNILLPAQVMIRSSLFDLTANAESIEGTVLVGDAV